MRVSEGNCVELRELDEDLMVEEGGRVRAAQGVQVVRVAGDILCRGDVVLDGNFECHNFEGENCRARIGSLSSRRVEIKDGELEVLSDLSSESIDVDRRLRVRGKTTSERIEVGGILELTSVKAQSIEVGGKFEASSDVDVEEIEVGGVVEIRGRLRSRRLEVGGKALVSGGEITDSIDVGGVFESSEPLNFGEIDVGGILTLKGPTEGKDIDVGGRMRVSGDIKFAHLDVGGVADISGNATGDAIDIGGRLTVGSLLSLKEDLEVGGEVSVTGEAEARSVEVGGRLRAGSLRVEKAEFSGSVRTEKGVTARGAINVSHGSRVEGWIRAMDRINVESKATVDSLSAPHVIIEDRARAINIYAEEIIIGSRSDIQGEVLYTREIRLDPSARFQRGPPIKVDSIPHDKSWNV